MADQSIAHGVVVPKSGGVRARKRSLAEIAKAVAKYCPGCREVRPNTDFGISRRCSDGLFGYCRSCTSKRTKARYALDLDKSRETARTKAKKHRAANPDASKESARKSRAADGGARSRAAAMKVYYKDPQKHNARRREWEKKNPEKHTAEKLRWQKRREESDPVFRMVRAVRRRVTGILSGQKNGRRTFDLLGYHPDELRAHVESQFTEGMSWDNYGEWHLDHDRPIASFDFDQEGAMRECWALSNLKPMWKAANHVKAGIWNGVNWGAVPPESRKEAWAKRHAKRAATAVGVPMAEGPPT